VGVNKYKLGKEDPIDILAIDNVRVRDGQIERLKNIRATRDSAKVQAALDGLTASAESGQGNLLDLSIQAIRLRATVGEVSDALEKVFGRHRADTQKVTGVYAAAYDSAEGWDQLKKEINEFADAKGRRPRVMISKLGQDGHDRGANDCQRQALEACTEALAEEDGDEEVAQRHAVLGGGDAAHGGHCASNLHLDPPYGRHPSGRAPTPSLPCATPLPAG
jgi:hypothetical protein